MAAVDFFLKLDGIPGEAQDKKHGKSIDLQSWSWGEQQQGISNIGGGSGAGKVSGGDLHFTMKVCCASPKLFLAPEGGKGTTGVPEDQAHRDSRLQLPDRGFRAFRHRPDRPGLAELRENGNRVSRAERYRRFQGRDEGKLGLQAERGRLSLSTHSPSTLEGPPRPGGAFFSFSRDQVSAGGSGRNSNCRASKSATSSSSAWNVLSPAPRDRSSASGTQAVILPSRSLSSALRHVPA